MVKEATVGEGPTMRRIKSRARGSASPIRKRTSHIRIVLSDEIVLPQRNSVSKAKAKKGDRQTRRHGKKPAAAPRQSRKPPPPRLPPRTPLLRRRSRDRNESHPG